eukprot:TRINITY_DN7385_c0_g1_i1.p1 TRINITY_DN7385_c0_g1~~TRINITY_DN7385_c0_g1_i1.p1  ORF type:complete len:206 (+),score=62.56 TRINITY_DN7385_c0_g1_i1:283-900(+)
MMQRWRQYHVNDGRRWQINHGQKRRGRPSVELDLGQDFAATVPEDDDDNAPEASTPNDGNEADADTSATDGTAVAEKKKRKEKKARKRRKRVIKNRIKNGKYVFVQQLRLQQQHNDEINRVKTLWKQERQVRVEMHKKVLKQLKEGKVKMQEQGIEIERLTKTAHIGATSEAKLSEQFKEKMEKLQGDKEKLQGDLQKRESIYRL